MKIILALVSCVMIYLGISLPYFFLEGIFGENSLGIMFLAGLIIAVWLLISLAINLKNKHIIKTNKVKEIYVRDVDVEYSPAVLSLLLNNKIEASKDLSATLLNLCAKRIVKIEKTDGKIKIIDLKNKKEVEKLPPDEKYAYDMFLNGVTNVTINEWKNKVEAEYKKYNFSVGKMAPLGVYLFGLYAITFIVILIYCSITGSGDVGQFFIWLLFGSFIASCEMVLIYEFREIIAEFTNRKSNNEFRDIYTSKGAREFSKWKKFERFILDFSIIKEREHESVTLWGKYLSYSIALGINKKCDKEVYDKIEKEFLFDFDLFSDMYDYNE